MVKLAPVYRQSLAITGQNIANINTDGYKRRGAELEEMSATKASALEISQGKGMGVRVGAIRRHLRVLAQ